MRVYENGNEMSMKIGGGVSRGLLTGNLERVLPTNHYREPYSGIEDYELKKRITIEIRCGSAASA